MTVTVKFFAILRDRTGVSQTQLNLPEGADIHLASRRLAVEFPAIENLLQRLAYAVNENYTAAQTTLHDGDELALIPPVSGG